jgi:hypothetical protein
MLAADSTAIEDRYPGTAARAAPVKERVSLLRRAQGAAAGVLFLAARAPIYVGVLLFGALVALVGTVLYVIQAIGLRLTRSAGPAAAAAALALISIAGPHRAKADAIADTSLLQQTTLVFSQQTNLYAFDAPGAGTLAVTLKDWAFPVSLQQLTASIMSQDQVLGSWDKSKDSDWSFDVPISGGGLFDAFVGAQAGPLAPGVQFGAYSMSITFEPTASPVPLPPALDLLLGGMGLLGAMTLVERVSRRRNRDVISIA